MRVVRLRFPPSLAFAEVGDPAREVEGDDVPRPEPQGQSATPPAPPEESFVPERAQGEMAQRPPRQPALVPQRVNRPFPLLAQLPHSHKGAEQVGIQGTGPEP